MPWQATLAALATEREAISGEDEARLVEALDGLSSQPPQHWFGQARVAIDLHRIHQRLGFVPAGVLCADLRAKSEARFGEDREVLRRGGLRGRALLRWLAAHPPAQRDLAAEMLLGIAFEPARHLQRQHGGSDCIPSGVAPLVRSVHALPLLPSDHLVDLGSGLGKATMLLHLLSGASTHGLEIVPELVEEANDQAKHLALTEVSHEVSDARAADLGAATVLFLYLPFTGAALCSAMEKVHEVAQRHAVVVCALGIDLRAYPWLQARPSDELWLTLYDSNVPGVPRRPTSEIRSNPWAECVATERAYPGGES